MIGRESLHPRSRSRRGVAMVIVIVLIGLFAALCQTLTMLVVLQHRQAFHTGDVAQTHRLAEAGLRRALQRLQHDPAWKGETWLPAVPGGESTTVTIAARSEGGRIIVTSDAALTTTRDRTLKSHQSLTLSGLGVASAEGKLP